MVAVRNNYINQFAIIGLVWLLSSCGGSLKIENPEIDQKKPELPIAESYLNLPVTVNLYDLSADANSEIPQQLFKQDSIDVNSNVKVNLEIDRRGQISITTVKGNINTSIPIHIEGKALLSLKACNFCPKIEHTQPLSADITVITSTKLGIDEKWDINTQTNADFIFDKSPCINVIGFPICFESLTRMGIKKLLPKINALIDKKVNKLFNLKEVAGNYWKQISQPMQVLNNPVNIWAIFQPTEFNFTPPVSLDYNNLLLKLVLKTKIKTIVGAKPEISNVGDLPPIYNVPAKDNSFDINVPVAIELSEIRKVVMKEFVGKVIAIPNSKRTVLINNIDFIGSNKILVIKLNIESKRTKGDIYILAEPVYDSTSRCLKVENLKFDAKTNNILVNKANWLINAFFIRSVQNKVKYNLGNDIDKMHVQLEKSISSLPLNNRISLKVNIRNFDIQDISFDPAYAYLNVKVNGGLNVNIK